MYILQSCLFFFFPKFPFKNKVFKGMNIKILFITKNEWVDSRYDFIFSTSFV